MMSLTNSQQIQVYESLGQESGNIIHVFEKNTIINIHPVLNNPQPENPDLSISLSFELVIVMLLILTLPILIYVAYRYGKKMGKKEHHSYPSSKSNSPAMKTTLTMSQRSTGENLSESGEAEPEPPVPINNSAEVPRSRSNSNSKQLINKEDGNKLEKSKSSSQTSGSPKSSFETSSDKQEKEFCLDGKANSTIIENEINQANYQLNPCFDEPEKITENFTFLMKKTYDKETNVGNLGQSFDDEKIKLHTDDSQIKKQQIEVKLSFERKDGALQKVETQEIITVYCEDVKEPEKNALILKKAYENYQNDSAMIDKHFIELNNRGRNRKTTALVSLRTPPVYTNVLNLANQICLPEIENFDPVPESQEASKSSPEPCTLEELLEKDDLPHETGKFNKIFKNAEVIGQGSFGEVYKVVHKLDGKIYAVKKVKLRFGKLEELQQKSKVFREVFAMTDLHHPNIVRYSTCWVEIESGKESALTSTRENDAKSEYTRRVVLREVEEVEQSEQSQSSESSQSSNYHTKTSSMGFEWAVEDEKSEKPVSPVNKKKPKNFAQKKESSVFIKSLSKVSLLFQLVLISQS